MKGSRESKNISPPFSEHFTFISTCVEMRDFTDFSFLNVFVALLSYYSDLTSVGSLLWPVSSLRWGVKADGTFFFLLSKLCK